jgi:hypothetical protein
MPVMTHDSNWRLLVGAAPLFGVVFLVWAAAQGEAEIAGSPAVRGLLALIAALGAAVAWHTARQRQATPTVPVAQAEAMARAGQLDGVVAMRGRAQALPEAPPLVSPDGELCLWFRHGEAAARHASVTDSVRPFLLVDDSGRCIVLPAGAEVTGDAGAGAASPAAEALDAGEPSAAGARAPRTTERLLRDGDRIRVRGRFVAASAEAQALQSRAATHVGPAQGVPSAPRESGPDALRAAAGAGAAFAPAAPWAAPGLALPVLAAPAGLQPFVIDIVSDDGEPGLYGVLAVIDALVLVAAAGLSVWAVLAAR